MNAHVIDRSPNEPILMSYYLLPIANHQSLTGRHIFPFTITMTDCDWPIKVQIQTAFRWQSSSVVE